MRPTVHSATTNMHGVVEYGETSERKDETLPYLMKDLVEVPDEITISPKSSFDLKLLVTMPERMFNGMLAGGITLEEKEEA
nr:DUF916 domain-containing protein [Listeria floridensis]